MIVWYIPIVPTQFVMIISYAKVLHVPIHEKTIENMVQIR